MIDLSGGSLQPYDEMHVVGHHNKVVEGNRRKPFWQGAPDIHDDAGDHRINQYVLPPLSAQGNKYVPG